MLGMPERNHGFLGERCGRAGLDAGAAGDAFGFHEGLALTRRDLGVKAAPLDGERQCALLLIAGAHAARAHDAKLRIKREIRVTRVLHCRAVFRAGIAVGSLGDARIGRHVLQLAVAVRRAGGAIERVIGDVEIKDSVAQLRKLGRLGRDLHARHDRGGTRGGIAFAALDLNQAQAAGAEGLQGVRGAQLRNLHISVHRRAHDRGAFGHRDRAPVDLERDRRLAVARRASHGLCNQWQTSKSPQESSARVNASSQHENLRGSA